MTRAFLRAARGILLSLFLPVVIFIAGGLLSLLIVKPSSPQPPVPAVVVIEGCQYFKIPNVYGDVGTLVHKGNCTNH